MLNSWHTSYLSWYHVLFKSFVIPFSPLSFWNEFFRVWIWTHSLVQIGLSDKKQKTKQKNQNGKEYRSWWDGLLLVISIESPGWSGGAKVLCILHHRGVQLILAYSWARPAILVVGKGSGGMFLFLPFLHFHSCSSFFPVPLFHLLYSLFYLFSPFLWETTQNDPQGLTCR